jgi:hyperosmotically inducible protein
MSDSDLKNAIKTRLDSDPQLKADDLGVSADADKNTATLSGTVESEALRTKAVEMARAAHSGLVVTDKIDVKPREIERKDYTEENARVARENAKSRGETVGSSMDDAWIHTKVVTKLIGDSRTPERKINVDVVNNVVTLRGAVRTAEEKTAAEQVAKSVDGVKSVKNMLKIDPNA